VNPDPNLNALWSRCIAEEFKRAGITHAVLCPGSRNSPLVFALAAALGDGCISHIDERSGAFIALGLARATGRPAVICVTSGSALANCLPAIAEASAMAIPLLVAAADRPWELHDCGAPQSMPQCGIFRDFLAGELDLGEPTAVETALRALRSRVSRIAQVHTGPTMINVPMRDPLPPLPDPSWTPPPLSDEALHGRGHEPFTRVSLPGHGSLPECPWLRPGLRGLIIAGANAGRFSPQISELARLSGFPLLADAASSLRRGDMPNLVCAGDALISGKLGELEPDLIIQVGIAPVARPLYEFIARQRCPLLLLEDAGNRDFPARAWASVRNPADAVYTDIGERCHAGDRTWRDRWLNAESQARERLTTVRDESWSEITAAHIAVNHPAFTVLHLASSMPVRHGNLHFQPRTCRVHANRGLNGVDGTIGTFIGEAKAHTDPALLLCGDLAFLHDLPALCAARSLERAAIVILNNDGGAIFDFLPAANVPEYPRWVRTPHGMDFSAAAAQFGLPYHKVASAEDLKNALRHAATAAACTIIECAVVDPDGVRRQRKLIDRITSQ
jgi:2-succinyl-5-enolpyruvyl-6-hydroxy-3-cyclohexene-1-carboxylate synthase